MTEAEKLALRGKNDPRMKEAWLQFIDRIIDLYNKGTGAQRSRCEEIFKKLGITYPPKVECVCGEINARNCGVHGGD